MNKKTILKIVKYIASLGFAFGILYLLFKNQDPVQLVKEIQKVDGKWVLLSMVFGGWAYVSRGLRWIVLIDALGYKSSKLNSISAVSVGYFTNMFIPRAGEISRCTALNQVEKVPVDKLFGTILIERVIDFVFLISLIFLTVVLKFNDIFKFYTTLQAQQTESTGNDKLFMLLGILVGGGVLFYFAKKWLKKSKFYEKVLSFIDGLKEGFKSIKNMKRKSAFWFQTFSIWIMYFLMTYICFFCMDETSHLTASDGLFLLVLGGIGMVIPTPGGVGSYHAIVMIGLSVLGVGTVFLGEGGDPTNPALLFPTIVHVAQTLVAIIMGSVGLLVLFLSKKKSNVAS
ncbi:MAG: flippase-like domain-containing protein [Flavobacteriales bacterium]|nr:flippase-like domain-containing protein [Flavobacteriales bacterium]MBT4881860.1 flippase-like domain-containing protein [Flavobacteriales bacterium]MDG1348096.1 lysylphosphatidylglycerol synthase transmembrane domain-containing protein [Flavobacteriales bacterium]